MVHRLTWWICHMADPSILTHLQDVTKKRQLATASQKLPSISHGSVATCLRYYPLPSSRQHLNNDDYLQNKREDYRNCSVLCWVRQLCTMTHTHTHTWAVLKDECWFRFGFSFLCVCLGLAFCVFFCFSLDYFVRVLFAFVVPDIVSSLLGEESDWEERLQNDLFCDKWDVKP